MNNAQLSLPGVKKQLPHLRAGSTLLEIILFLGILSIMSGAIVSVYISTQEARINQRSIAELDQAGAELLQTMTKNIRRAEKILAPAMNTSGSILTLQMSENNEYPTIFARNASGNLINVQKTSLIGLFTPHVTISSLSFRNVADISVTFSFNLTITIPSIVPKLYTRKFGPTVVTLFPGNQSAAGGCGGCPNPMCVDDQYIWNHCNNGACEVSSTTFPGCSTTTI